MNYKNIIIEESNFALRLILNRPEAKNSMSSELLDEINHFLDSIANDSKTQILTIESNSDVFCSGMDFSEASKGNVIDSGNYIPVLRKFSLLPKVVVALVDGPATAGGVGLVAASDYVFASSKANFTLSEALWGLIPAMVVPYIIRRIGFQKAYQMTLSTIPVSAAKAYEIGLADEVTEELEKTLKKLWFRLRRLETETIGKTKAYFRDMWIINQAMEEKAGARLASLMAEDKVKENISNFVNHQIFPWDNKR